MPKAESHQASCPKQPSPHTRALLFLGNKHQSFSAEIHLCFIHKPLSPGEKLNRERERDTQHQHEDENSQSQICLSASLSLLFRDLVRYRLGRWKTEDTQMLVSECQGLGSRVLSLEVLTKRYLLWQQQEPLRSHSGATQGPPESPELPYAPWHMMQRSKHTFDQAVDKIVAPLCSDIH